ncbi:hypothetical protein [Klebsiella quasipneumoniae]|uniref:hypothetical protein n=1 Tax=Klebsiella quasipneumoniae TaxID=1463165 RepID=UPI0022037EDB|nr:hypothetical protein [Klebsiella quasipneumoniae]BDO05798.1 hypothetical protein KAM622c_53850 [Klebsiella quasipneumoniae subsp. quasipneumoniae]
MLINNKVKKEIKAKRKKASKIFWTCHYIEKKYPQPIFIALFWLPWLPLIAYIKLFPQFSPLIALAIYGLGIIGIITILSVWFYLDFPKSWIDSLDRQILKYLSFIDELKDVHTDDFIEHGKEILTISDISDWANDQEWQLDQLDKLHRKYSRVKIKKEVVESFESKKD